MNEEELLALLEEVARRCKADRSPYVPTAYFKHIPKHREKLDELKRKGLVFLYKAGRAVGISKKGLDALREKRGRP